MIHNIINEISFNHICSLSKLWPPLLTQQFAWLKSVFIISHCCYQIIKPTVKWYLALQMVQYYTDYDTCVMYIQQRTHQNLLWSNCYGDVSIFQVLKVDDTLIGQCCLAKCSWNQFLAFMSHCLSVIAKFFDVYFINDLSYWLKKKMYRKWT